MSTFPYNIHEFLTERRRWRGEVKKQTEVETKEKHHEPVRAKEYLRMPFIELAQGDLSMTLSEALTKRVSTRETPNAPLELSTVGGILTALKETKPGNRPQPSGGALYPIETYLLANKVSGLERGAYHYNPHKHGLEHLWDMPKQPNMFVHVNEWANEASAVVMFTGRWWRNHNKYGNFGYLLGLLETGHAAQNVLLAAAALNVGACALAGFDDRVVTDILDLDSDNEQPLYCVALN